MIAMVLKCALVSNSTYCRLNILMLEVERRAFYKQRAGRQRSIHSQATISSHHHVSRFVLALTPQWDLPVTVFE